MPDSVKERIEKQKQLDLRNALPGWLDDEIASGRLTSGEKAEKSVHRWDVRPRWIDPQGNTKHSLDHYDVFMRVSAATPTQGADGNVGQTMKDLAIAAYVVIRQPEDEPINSNELYNLWIGRLEAQLMADWYTVEAGTNARLTRDCQYLGATEPPFAEHQREFIAGTAIRARYQHPRDDPYTPN